jgi:hypothetical protein
MMKIQLVTKALRNSETMGPYWFRMFFKFIFLYHYHVYLVYEVYLSAKLFCHL